MLESSKVVLEVSGITVSTSFGGLSVDVLQDISFRVEAGKVLGIIGESGAGKSMIGRVVMNVLPTGFAVTGGSVRLGGENILAMSPARQQSVRGRDIAFIPQDPQGSMNPVMSIGAHFDEQLRRLGFPSNERRDRTMAALQSVELSAPEILLRKYPHELSGGMCQRVMIALAFVAKPTLIIADEPTTALDALTQARVIELLQELQAQNGTSVIFVTHDLRLAAHACDDVLVLYAGQGLEFGPSKEVFAHPRHPYTRRLQASNPPLSGPLQRLPTLPDQMPGLDSFGVSSGCRFWDRCPVSDEDCCRRLPEPVLVAARHWVRASPRCLERGTELKSPAVATPGPGKHRRVVLDVDNVHRHYPTSSLFGKTSALTAVDDVSLELHEGEFLGVVGLSGSGKSTLARMLVGLEQPDTGRIRLEGYDTVDHSAAAKARRLRTIQMIFQNPQSSLNPRRTVGDLVTQAYEGTAAPTSGETRSEAAARLLRDVGLPLELATRYPMQLSGGQRQRIGIARALCVNPSVIVADEIVSGLDVSIQAQVLNLLLDLKERTRISLVFITHDLSVVRYLCDRTLVMRGGAVVEEGATQDVLHSPQHPYTRALLAAVPPDDPYGPWRSVITSPALA